MKGLRIYRSSVELKIENGTAFYHHGTIEKNRSDFDYIFRPIYGLLKDYYILNDQLPIVKKYKKYIVQENTYYVVARAEILNECGRNIPEFEGNLLTFVNEIPPVMSWKEFSELTTVSHPKYVCSLFNWDGVYWDIYTEHAHILEKFLLQHSNDIHLEIYHVDSKIDFPHPARSRDKLNPI